MIAQKRDGTWMRMSEAEDGFNDLLGIRPTVYIVTEEDKGIRSGYDHLQEVV